MFSENSYKLRIYQDAIVVFLQQEPGYKIDLHLNFENILNFGQTLLQRMQEEKGVFRVSRSKKVFEIVTSFDTMLHLVSKFSFMKKPVSDADQENVDKLFISMKKLTLWNIQSDADVI